MSEETEEALISLLDELLEKGDFFHSTIERNDMLFDFEEWRVRMMSALEKAKAKR